MSKHQYNSQEDLQLEDDGTESVGKNDIVMNRNYLLTKTEEEHSPMSH